MKRAVILCPGRGSYGATELGYLSQPAAAGACDELDAAISRSDGLRTARGDLTIRAMDGAKKFRPEFFRGENASGLTFACTAFDLCRLDTEVLDIVAVGGNSMGWYSALYAAGVFDLNDGFDLVETMGGMSRDEAVGGQLIYPIADDGWRADPRRVQHVDDALAAVTAAGHQAGHSIRYGGFAILWADAPGLSVLAEALPGISAKGRQYPLTLPEHSAFHSPLMRHAATRGLDQLAGLPWQAPTVPLIDGRGVAWRPLTTDPAALCRYTLETQVLETFDFTATVRVALREYAPDCIVLPGPGNALGAAVAQILIAERWRGIDSREAFLERQSSDPFVVSMALADQAERVVAAHI